jgi:N-acetylglucosamine kinase-like BadF-type ATPase
MGMAGVDRPEDRLLYEEWAVSHFPNATVTIVNDAELVLPAGTPEGWGIGVICGTGATVVGRSPAGATARADGWGHLLGDDGSGYWIGMQGLRAIFQAVDGRGPATALQPAIFAAWNIASHEPIMTRLYVQDAPPAEIAALAAVVDQCAEEGDAVAARILARAGLAIAESVEAVARRLGMGGALPIGLAGGVILKSNGVKRSMLNEAAARGLQLSPVTLVDRPVVGAIRMAVQAHMG